MRIVTFLGPDGPRPGVLSGDDRVVDLSAIAPTVSSLIEAGPAAWDAARVLATAGDAVQLGRLLAPLRPSSLRDFLAFEDHAKGGARRRNEELNPAWYETPVYYKGNHRSVIGPDADVPWPSFTEKLDFELELGCVLGALAIDLDESEAASAIFGYTVMNDWSARDVQRSEMAMRLGPSKSKDFATSLGPCIVTADEFDPSSPNGMIARVNGQVWCEASTADMHWTFPRMIAHVSRGESVWPADVYGSGTPFGGCGLDLDRWIRPDDVVELEIAGIGVLRNRVVRDR
ncbi:MAG: fumarylacetoacetate hydrolase family protein [Actinomycetota bacterium]